MSTLPLAEACRADVISSMRQFLQPGRSVYQVLIVSYETFRIHANLFKKEGSCDLLICDEAHRLKNDATATTMALAQLPCRRRVLLSGTPMQNDLGEFYAMVCRKLATALSGSATVPQTALLILSVGELHQPRCAR